MRLEERKRVTEREGMRLTNYFLVMVPQNDEEIALLDQIARSGSTFTGEIKYPYCEIQLQGPANHSERTRDPIQTKASISSDAWSAAEYTEPKRETIVVSEFVSERARDAAQPVEIAEKSANNKEQMMEG